MDWKQARNVETFNCDRGSQKDYKATLSADVSDWPRTCGKTSSSNLKGLKPKANVGKEYYFNIEVLAHESRGWHRFTGFSFESYNGNSYSSNTMYLRKIATCWVNEDGDMQVVGSPLTADQKSSENTYYWWNYEFRDDSEEKKIQDEGYKLVGFRFNFRSKSGTGSASWKNVTIFNLRLHTNIPDMPDGTRVVLPKMHDVDTVWDADGLFEPLGYGDKLENSDG